MWIGFLAGAMAITAGVCGALVHGDPPPKDTGSSSNETREPSPVPGAVERPEAAQRIVARFDFEEAAVYTAPRYWRRLATRPTELDAQAPAGFPIWNDPALELDAATSYQGTGSVRLETRGGSVGLRLDAGVIPIFPDAEYLISAMVRTGGLVVSSPVIVARYLDKSNEPIGMTEVRVELDADRSGEHGGTWRLATLAVPSAPATAAYLQLDLLLLQPGAGSSTRETPTGVSQDFSGSVQFDDVTVVQLPRVTLRVGRGPSSGSCFISPERPELTLLVRDLAGEALTCVMTLQDIDGEVVDRDVRTLPRGAAQETWKPRLRPGREFGWYRATLDLVEGDETAKGGGRVGSTYVDFCVLPPEGVLSGFNRTRLGDRERFGVAVRTLVPRAELAPAIQQLITASGSGMALIPAWEKSLKEGDMARRVADLERTIARLTGERRTTWLGLAAVPDDLAKKVRDGSRVEAVLSEDESLWSPWLLAVIDRFGSGVQRWTIGDTSLVHRSTAKERMEAIESVRHLLPGVSMLAMWPMDLIRPANTMTVGVVDPGASPETIGQAARDVWQPGQSRFEARGATALGSPALLLRQGNLNDRDTSASGADVGGRDAAMLLARGMIEAWAEWGEAPSAGGPSMLIEEPWRVDGPGVPRAMPTPELAVWRTVSAQLAGRRVVGRVTLAEGVECLILRGLEPSRPGAIVAWRTTAARSESVIDADLGDGDVEVVDVFGNRKKVRRGGPMVRVEGPDFDDAPIGRPTASAEAGMTTASGPSDPQSKDIVRSTNRSVAHRIEVPSTPIFVEGVDIPLARFIAGFRVEPGMLSMFKRDHLVSLVLENPWPVAVEGRLRILEPGGLSGMGKRDRGWVIAPRILAFAMAPGETLKLPVQVAFSPAEEAGTKQMIAEVELTAERVYDAFIVRAPMELGLDTIDLALEGRLTPDPITGPDAEVRVQVVNRSNEPLSMELVAWAEGYPRGKATASKVPPGGVILRKFQFPDGVAKLRGQRVTVGVEDVQSRARLTRSVVVE